jgi:hypothetical protein
MTEFSSCDSETPEGNIALLCTPTECYDIETWEDFTSKFMVKKNLKTTYFTWNNRFDCQAILKFLPYNKLKELWKAKKHKITYKGYRITYIPKKLLTISEIDGKKGAIRLLDAAQYYENKSLDSQAQKYLGTGKLPDVSAKKIGKSRKYYDKNYDKIVEYCKRDADLTLKLALLAMKNIRQLGFNPSNPISPASISRKYQRKRGFPLSLKKMKGLEKKANAFAMLAYKGGVFATYKRGFFNQPLYDYDVNSCYPAIMIDLPDWRNGRFEFIEEKPENYEYGWIWCDIDTEYIPYQDKELYTVKEVYEGIGEWDMKYTAKKVTYPTGLRTEVITTEEYRWLKANGERVKWLGEGMGWVQENNKYPNPFAWLKEMYGERQKAKDKGDTALATTMKVLMNSLYGSTVQRKNGIGDLSNFCYGSYITGRARIQMFDVVKQNYDKIVNVATDGLLSTSKLVLKCSEELGEWEYNEYTKGLIIGNGIRQLWEADSSFVTHARGITSDRSYDLLGALEKVKDKSELPVGRTRVIQLGTMINAHIKWKHEHLNTFVKQSRVLSVHTDKKRTWDREYENFGDLLGSPPMGGKPLCLE